MKLAVMMAAYNAQAHIEAALKSIVTQSGIAELDVIVVDDGSTDDTAAVISDIAKNHPQIRLIRTQNQGIARARNEGLKALQNDTDFVSFLDADDLVPPGRYERDLEFFKQDPLLDLTFGVTMMFRQPNEENTAPAENSETACGRCIQLASGTYRAQKLLDVGLFDVSFRQAEDMDFLLRFMERSPRYRVHEDTSIYYRRHGGNVTRDRAQLKRDFSRALLLSIKRRKLGNLPAYPADLFDAKGFAEAHGW
ncbi:glycosyltransferase family 2 protein [Brucellaceae bacterium C25G]